MKYNCFQIHYNEYSKARLDDSFIGYDNSQNKYPGHREYRVFHEEYHKGTTGEADYTGFISWKFNMKSLISGQTFLKWIKDNPGYDVYFVNPFYDQLVWDNIWDQGDYFHPGLKDLTQRIFTGVGYDPSLLDIKTSDKAMAFCNYWIGNQKFWDTYMGFTEPIYDYVNNHLNEKDRQLFEGRADRSIDAPYMPFLMERMFTQVIQTKKDIKWIAYQYPREYLIEVYGLDFVELIEGLIEQRKKGTADPRIESYIRTQRDKHLQTIEKLNVATAALEKSSSLSQIPRHLPQKVFRKLKSFVDPR